MVAAQSQRPVRVESEVIDPAVDHPSCVQVVDDHLDDRGFGLDQTFPDLDANDALLRPQRVLDVRRGRASSDGVRDTGIEVLAWGVRIDHNGRDFSA